MGAWNAVTGGLQSLGNSPPGLLPLFGVGCMFPSPPLTEICGGIERGFETEVPHRHDAALLDAVHG